MPLPIIQVEVRIFEFIIIVNSIDYMRTYQRGLIGELVGREDDVKQDGALREIQQKEKLVA